MRACPTSVAKAFSYTALRAAIDHEEKVEDEEKVEKVETQEVSMPPCCLDPKKYQ